MGCTVSSTKIRQPLNDGGNMVILLFISTMVYMLNVQNWSQGGCNGGFSTPLSYGYSHLINVGYLECYRFIIQGMVRADLNIFKY